MSISQLDIVLLGSRGITGRLGSIEGALRSAGGQYAGVGTNQQYLVRPNLFTNSSFEFYNRNATAPQDWVVSLLTLNVNAAGADGHTSVTLAPTGSVHQIVANGSTIVAGAVVFSVAARTLT